MSLTELNGILSDVAARFSRGDEGKGIMGVDICGGISEEKGGREADMELNRATLLDLAGIFRNC